MAHDLELRDHELARAGERFLAAAQEVEGARAAMPGSAFPSITGIGESVRQFLEALGTAQAALSDAARTASEEAAAVITDSSELDSSIADTASGFALPDSPSLRRGGAR